MKKNTIISNIKKIQDIPVSAEWLNNGRKNLQSFIVDNPVRNLELDRHSRQKVFFKKLIFKPMPIAMLAIILSLITGGGVVTASQNSLPTDKLYPVKLIIEKVETAVTFNEVKKVALQTKLADKRLEEIKNLQDQGRANKAVVEKNLREYQDNLAKAQEYLVAVNAEDSVITPRILAASMNLERAVNNQQSTIESIEASAPEEYKATLSEGRKVALNNSGQSLEKIRTKINEGAKEIFKVGEGRDKYGCIPSAGYSWCEEKQKCLRPWEEKCNNQVAAKDININSNNVVSGQVVAGSGTIVKEIIGEKEITANPIPVNDKIISEEMAIKIAAEAGLAKGIKEWKTELYWYYGKINNYVWAVSNFLSKYHGQTVIIEASSGKVYEIIDYQISITPPLPIEEKEKPSICPEYIDCMPKIIEPGEKPFLCQIPDGCEGITNIVY